MWFVPISLTDVVLEKTYSHQGLCRETAGKFTNCTDPSPGIFKRCPAIGDDRYRRAGASAVVSTASFEAAKHINAAP
jgi:hypothetical protein